MADTTIQSLFLTACKKHRDKCLFRYHDDGSWKTMSYGEFFSFTKIIAGLIENNHIQKGERLAIVSENRPEWCASYISIVGCGGIAVPVDIQLGSDEIRNVLRDSGAKIVFCSDKTEDNVLNAAKGTESRVVSFDTETFLSHSRLDGQTGPCQVAPDDTASLIYTSGTTGKPKGVLLTHRNFCSDAEAIIQADLVTHEDNVLSILPLHHTYPFMCTFLVPFFLGATITFGVGLKAPDILSAIKDNGVTVLVGVPRLFDMLRNGILSKIKERDMLSGVLLRVLKLSGVLRRRLGLNIGRAVFASVHKNFAGVKFFASGGARLDPAVMADLEAMGFTVLEGYGLTETSPVITFNPIKKRKPGSAGTPLPGVEIKICDDGEIAARGPMVMKGYYRNEAATREVIKDGWLFTGDLGLVDKDGYLFITGRKKEVIVLSSGKNVYPEDVEKAYLTIPLIKELCVIASKHNDMPDGAAAGTADAVWAVIVPDLEYAQRNSIGNINDDLSWRINEVSYRLPEYMRIRGYVLSSEPLPRTRLGKLRRFLVRDSFQKEEKQKDRSQKDDQELLADPIAARVAGCIRALMDASAAVRLADNLELDLGFDSLKKLELIASLEDVFTATLPDTFISEAHTVSDVVAKLKGYAESGQEGLEGLRSASTLSWQDILGKELSPADAGKIGYEYSPLELVIVYVALAGLKLFFKIAFRFEVQGREHISGEQPFVITPNHASYLDGFIIAASLPFSVFRKLYFLGMKEFFTGRAKSWFARLAHVIPIDAESYLNRALQLSSYVLTSGRSLCVFPEGGRSFDGSVMPFKKGIGVLALERNVPAIPVYIDGAFSALPRGAFIIRPMKIKVVFGEKILPAQVAAANRHPDRDRYQAFADNLRERVIDLAKKGA